MENTLLMTLSDYYSKLSYDDLPIEVIQKARRSVLDFFSVLAVGYKVGKLSPVINQYLKGYGNVKGSIVLGPNYKVPPYFAALSMGVMAHSVELDDGHRFGTAHPAVAIIPAALAISEKYDRNFKELLLSIVIGYDTMLRVACAINPSHLTRGFHTSGTSGCIGSSFTCAKLARYSKEKMAHTVAIGSLRSSGLQEMLHDNPSIKPLQVGDAAAAGVRASDLVALGATGPRTLFEGDFGWLKAMSDNYDIEYISAELGNKWEILNTYTKLYPTCRHCHAAIDLMIEAKEQLNKKNILNQVKQITIRTYEAAIREVGEIVHPKSIEDAMFSMAFSVALAFKYGKVTLDLFNEANFNNNKLRELSEKIDIVSDEIMNNKFPLERGASLYVLLSDGKTYKKYLSLPAGEKETPLTDEMLYSKMVNILTPYYKKAFCEQLWDLLINEKVTRVSYKKVIELFNIYIT